MRYYLIARKSHGLQLRMGSKAALLRAETHNARGIAPLGIYWIPAAKVVETQQAIRLGQPLATILAEMPHA